MFKLHVCRNAALCTMSYLLFLELLDFKGALRDGVETGDCDAMGVSEDSATTLGSSFAFARTGDANLNRGLGFVHTSGAF